ncbi:MAG TPA: hypothetical protein VGK67_37835 [Myxococcales bacterium]|jgi:ElaB/YqjD/DUF883 family membrane-anchored ribosome-binding protein
MEGEGQDGAVAGAKRAMSDLEERLGPQMELVRDRLASFGDRAVGLLRTYPGTSLIVALGAGFLLGRLASRR